MRDLHNNIAFDQKGIHAVAIGTTGTGKTTGAVNTAGYNRVEFLVDYGTVTATNAVFTALMTECDTTGGSFTSVADADLVGTEALVGLAAAATRTSGVSKNVAKRIGYIGNKQYLKLKVSSTVTAGTPISIIPLLGSPRNAPTS
jgi:hypothetical protein